MFSRKMKFNWSVDKFTIIVEKLFIMIFITSKIILKSLLKLMKPKTTMIIATKSIQRRLTKRDFILTR